MSQPVDAPTLADLVSAVHECRTRLPGAPRTDAAPSDSKASRVRSGPSVTTVIGAHAGAGTSTLALAVAENLAERLAPRLPQRTARTPQVGQPASEPRGSTEVDVQLIDTAPRHLSGLVAAAEHELGSAEGWQRGRRGRVELRRRLAPIPCGDLVPLLRGLRVERLVVDATWPVHQLVTAAGPHTCWQLGNQLVLVCRASVPGVRRAEQALAELSARGHRPVVAAVGASMWAGPVRSSLGPALSEAWQSGRMVLVPHSRQLAVHGIDTQPLPRVVTAAIAPLVGPPVSSRHLGRLLGRRAGTS